MSGKVYIGTSGWSYKHWKESFYPPKLKATDWFDYYASFFSCTENQYKFLSFTKAKDCGNLGFQGSRGIFFCPKLSRYAFEKAERTQRPTFKIF